MRGKNPKTKIIRPDYKYNSTLVAKFINTVMYDGKKTVAEKIVYDAIEKLGKLAETDPIIAFDKALDNVKPKVEVRAKRLGGANYQVPTPVRDVRQVSLSIKWLIDAARGARVNTTFTDTLSNELFSAFKGEGNAIKKRDEVHRMAEANKAFAHLAWQ